MRRGVVSVVVDTQHDGDVFILGRCRDDHLASPSLQMKRCLGAFGEESGGLDDHINTEFFPRELGRIALAQNTNLIAVDTQSAVEDFDLTRIAPVHGVVLEQVGEGGSVGQVVDRDEVEIADAVFLRSAQHIAADSTETVDRNSGGHRWSLFT